MLDHFKMAQYFLFQHFYLPKKQKHRNKIILSEVLWQIFLLTQNIGTGVNNRCCPVSQNLVQIEVCFLSRWETYEDKRRSWPQVVMATCPGCTLSLPNVSPERLQHPCVPVQGLSGRRCMNELIILHLPCSLWNHVTFWSLDQKL